MNMPYVKVRFPLEQDEDGYPPESCETLWAIDLGDGQYRLDNIPFYAKLISDGDIIAAKDVDNQIVFERVLSTSDNCTVRIIVKDVSRERDIRAYLTDLGCRIEGVGIPGFIAISFHKDLYSEVLRFLDRNLDEGVLDYEEASLR